MAAAATADISIKENLPGMPNHDSSALSQGFALSLGD
jgi:hypothetical protein